MSKIELLIEKWGTGLGVRLPAAILKAVGWRENQRVRVAIHEGKVVIEPVTDAPLSLQERLALYDPAKHGGEAMSADRVGAEGLVGAKSRRLPSLKEFRERIVVTGEPLSKIVRRDREDER